MTSVMLPSSKIDFCGLLGLMENSVFSSSLCIPFKYGSYRVHD